MVVVEWVVTKPEHDMTPLTEILCPHVTVLKRHRDTVKVTVFVLLYCTSLAIDANSESIAK